MQPTPTMPTVPAKIGGKGGVKSDVDIACRQQAYEAAEATKQQNVSKEVLGTVAGVAVGAVAGKVLSPTTYSYHGGYYRYLGGGYYGYAPGHVHGHTQNLAPLGAAAGGVAGAAMAQGSMQNLQGTYDMVYNNCIAMSKAKR